MESFLYDLDATQLSKSSSLLCNFHTTRISPPLQSDPIRADVWLHPNTNQSRPKADLIQEEQQFQPILGSQFVPAGVAAFPDPVFKFLRLVMANSPPELGLKSVRPAPGHVLQGGDLDRTWYRNRPLASLDQGPP